MYFSISIFAIFIAGTLAELGAIKGPITVAHCRAQCLDKFMEPGWDPEDSLCQSNADCYMCWESCELLNQNFAVWGSMCGHDQICFSGCRQSCAFFVDNAAAKASGITTMRFPGALSIETNGDGNLKLDWPAAVPVSDARNSISSGDALGNTVYLILRRSRGSDSKRVTANWQQVTQTSELTATLQLPSSASSSVDIKVLAVTGSGTAGQIAASWAQMSRDDWGGKTRPLRLRLLALRRKGTDAEAVVTWAAPGVTDMGGAFVVTWEAREGSASVSGHLVSEVTVASIPLRLKRVYSVRVEAVSGPAISAGRSEPLIIDATANFALDDTEETVSSTAQCPPTSPTAIYAAAVVAAAIGVVGVVAIVWLCLRGRSSQRQQRVGVARDDAIRRAPLPPLRLKPSSASIALSPAPRLYPAVFEPRLSSSHLERLKREPQVFDWNIVQSPRQVGVTDPVTSSQPQKEEVQRLEVAESSPRSPSMEFLLVGEMAADTDDEVASVAQSLPPEAIAHFVPKRRSRRIMSTHV